MVGTRLRAKFRRRKTRRLGGDIHRQNKQTLKYLVDKHKRDSVVVYLVNSLLQIFHKMCQ